MTGRTNLLSLGACCALFACGNTGAPERNYGPLLKNLTEHVILPEHHDFADQADALVVAAQALSDDPNAATLKAAQASWRQTRRAWRMLDAVHLGPELTLHIQERIDVSPVDADGIETLVSGASALDAQAVANAGGKKKGFLGLEYVLFSDLAAAPGTPPPALAADDAAARRRTWALGMADEIAQSARQLEAAWQASAGNYAAELELAGVGSTQYATQRAAVSDLVAGGVAYALEYIVGVRLALPLGRASGGTPMPQLDPTSRSDSAVADMQATLGGVAALYTGAGFSAAVRAKKADLDQAVLRQLEASNAALGAISAPFADAVTESQTVSNAYDVLKGLKTTWNTDVSSALGAIPKPSDTDGD
jgi:predicted lipoprotein